MVGFVRGNPAALPAIAFMVLLLGAAVELALGDEAAANRLAEYAYYALVVAVVVALVDAVYEGRRVARGLPAQALHIGVGSNTGRGYYKGVRIPGGLHNREFQKYSTARAEAEAWGQPIGWA